MGLLDRVFPWLRGNIGAPPAAEKTEPTPDLTLPGEPALGSTERGRRTTPENQLKYLYRLLWVDPDVRQTILDVREMDRTDGRAKAIHSRAARDITRGGLVFNQATESKWLADEWEHFARRLQLDRMEKLRSDARALVVEGNLALQWVLDADRRVVGGVRMPSETIIPDVDENGRFNDVGKAYLQFDINRGLAIAAFPLWQLSLVRFDPDSFDDLGSLGRPFLDASRATWRKLKMAEEDLVIRRRVRAPMRMSHVLEGASKEDLEAYRARVEADSTEITTDYYMNRKGGVTAIQGDANLDQIADVVHLLDTFFAGSPLPKGLMGYTDKMARDILADLKQDYYDEIDALQDTISQGYEAGFRLHLLLQGVNPDAEDWCVEFAERRTESPSQTADRALKWQALGMPKGLIWSELGQNPEYVRERLEYEAANYDPYPQPDAIGAPGTPRVSITPGNAPKGNSATAISNS